MYSAICRLSEDSWLKWNLSLELKDILKFSKTLRDNRKAWKVEAHRNRNRTRNPVVQECRTCADLDNSQKCIQYLPVQESNLTDVLKNKLIVPEEHHAINPVVCKSVQGLMLL